VLKKGVAVRERSEFPQYETYQCYVWEMAQGLSGQNRPHERGATSHLRAVGRCGHCLYQSDRRRSAHIAGLSHPHRFKADQSYPTQVHACLQTKKLDLAAKVLEDMHNAELAPPLEAANQKLYTMLMTALGKQWRPDEALQVFERMQAAGIRPNLIAYNAIVSAVRPGRHCRSETASTASPRENTNLRCREAGIVAYAARRAGWVLYGRDVTDGFRLCGGFR
jgi:pentatricopeptide repeat protein